LSDRLAKIAIDTYHRFPFLREWVKGLRPGNRTQLKKSLRRTGIMPTAEGIDHARSKVIPSNFGLRMWINDDKRFPLGLVPSEERDVLLAQLSEYLKQDRDPVTGESIIAGTYLGSELYSGPYAHRGPDLVIEYANLFDPKAQNPARNPHIEGGHTLQGIFLGRGPAIARSHLNAGSNLMDIAPTVLYLLDEALPPDMDGRVLEEIMTAERLRRHPLRMGNVAARFAEDDNRERGQYSPSQEHELKEQLRQLGYID
jgi:predicted AlkP superfamily phosphohydrolase/phosphomutase